MDRQAMTSPQQKKPEAPQDCPKNIEEININSQADGEAAEAESAQALPIVPGASNDVSSERPQARVAEHRSRVERHQGTTVQEKVEEEPPREPAVQDESDFQVTDPASHPSTTALLRSRDQADPMPSDQSSQPSSRTAATTPNPALHTDADSQANATANVQTNIIRPPNPTPNEGDSFHPELSMVVWFNGRWCELACPNTDCKANVPINKKEFFTNVSALRDHVTRSHNKGVKLSIGKPVERRNFLQSCVQRIFDDADVQRLSEGRDPIGGPIKKWTSRKAEKSKGISERRGDHDQSTPTVLRGEVDANVARTFMIDPQSNMKTTSSQSNPIYSRMTGDSSIFSYDDRLGQVITLRSLDDLGAYNLAVSSGSISIPSYSDQSGQPGTLRSWDDLDAYMYNLAVSRGSNPTNTRSILDSNRAFQTASLISRVTARHEEDPQNSLPIGPGLSATARLEANPVQTLTGIVDERNGTPSFSVDVNRFRDSRGARVQSSEDGDSHRSGDKAEVTLENEVK